MKSLLFKTKLTQKILSGHKTQTRRLVQPQPHESEVDDLTSPFALVGELMYVKETFYSFGQWVQQGYTKTGRKKTLFQEMIPQDGPPYYYADNPPYNVEISKQKRGWFKRNSLFMPEAATRAYLRVKSARIEKLQEITAQDAYEEGVNLSIDEADQIKDFVELWDSINPFLDFDSNPWVWRLEFEVVKHGQTKTLPN